MISTTTETLHKMLGNKIFSMVYTTKSGRLVKRLCQFGVKKYCKTPPKKYEHIINYYDHNKQGYRFANLGDIKAIKQGKINLKSNDFEEDQLKVGTFIVTTKQVTTREFRVRAVDHKDALIQFNRLSSLTAKSIEQDTQRVSDIEKEIF